MLGIWGNTEAINHTGENVPGLQALQVLQTEELTQKKKSAADPQQTAWF